MACGIHVLVHILRGSEWVPVSDHKTYRPERNYGLFATLADVRNHWGIKPIRKRLRGIPKDVLEDRAFQRYGYGGFPVPPEIQELGLGDHSHTWYTVQELLDFDWKKQAIQCEARLRVGKFREWRTSGGTEPPHDAPAWEPDRTKVDVKDIDPNTPKHWVVDFSYDLPLYQYCQEFTQEILPKLAKLHRDPSKVRFSVGFDT